MKTTRRQLGLLAAASAIPLRAHDDENPPAIARTTLINGAAVPLTVAGYLMGDYALAKLGLERGSVDVEVVHYSPAAPPWCSIVDGLQASTGASLGKMNLRREDSAKTYSVVRNRKSGQMLRFELLPGFLRQYGNLPEDKIYDAGAKVAEMQPGDVFGVR